jgi:hypothetical protein
VNPKLCWNYPAPGTAEAVSHKAPAIYEIRQVPIAKRRTEFRVQVTTESGAFVMQQNGWPRGFRTMQAAQRACAAHVKRMSSVDEKSRAGGTDAAGSELGASAIEQL